MKKYDKHMNYRGTKDQKSPEFDTRLDSEPFKNSRLDAVLEMYRSVRSSMVVVSGGGGGTGGRMEMKLIAGSANRALAEELAARLGVPITECNCER